MKRLLRHKCSRGLRHHGTIHVDKSTDVDSKATMLGFLQYILQEDVHTICLHALLLPTKTTAAKLCTFFNDYISGKLNGSFWVSICVGGAADWMAFWFYYLNQTGRFLMWVCTESTKKWLAEKCHLNLTTICWMWSKLSTTLKYMPLTHYCSPSSVRRWTQNTHVLSSTKKWDGFLKVDHWPEFLHY